MSHLLLHPIVRFTESLPPTRHLLGALLTASCLGIASCGDDPDGSKNPEDGDDIEALVERVTSSPAYLEAVEKANKAVLAKLAELEEVKRLYRERGPDAAIWLRAQQRKLSGELSTLQSRLSNEKNSFVTGFSKVEQDKIFERYPEYRKTIQKFRSWRYEKEAETIWADWIKDKTPDQIRAELDRIQSELDALYMVDQETLTEREAIEHEAKRHKLDRDYGELQRQSILRRTRR